MKATLACSFTSLRLNVSELVSCSFLMYSKSWVYFALPKLFSDTINCSLFIYTFTRSACSFSKGRQSPRVYVLYRSTPQPSLQTYLCHPLGKVKLLWFNVVFSLSAYHYSVNEQTWHNIFGWGGGQVAGCNFLTGELLFQIFLSCFCIPKLCIWKTL